MADKEAGVIDRMLVRIKHLDRLLNLVGEVIIISNNISTTNRRIQAFYDRGQPLDKISLDMIKTAEESSNRISSDLHSLVMDIRMVEISGTFNRFRRAVRDMARDAGKDVELEMLGGDTFVDKTIAEKLYDPLNHQVRNAIDHGIEDPLERQRLGKPAKAKLTLKASMRENNIYIEVKDDGRGIDADRLLIHAENKGLVNKGAGEKLSDKEKLNFIFHPGFSTKATASKLSGRGVGMDVVKSNIEELGGSVSIDTRLGKGSAFTYTIPQVTAVNILDCLTVRAGSNLLAVPILNVVSTLRVSSDKVHSTFEEGRTISYLGSLVTLYDLNELLGETPINEEESRTIVIVDDKNGKIALNVSELLAPEKLVYSPLSDIFDVQGISGVTTMSGNRMGLILDIHELIGRSKGIAKDGHEQAPDAGEVGEAPDEEDTGEALVSAKKESENDKPLVETVALSSDIGSDIGHRDEFLMELEEMVNNVGEEVLSLENNPGDTELINKTFRNFHSIKGNLMMVGLNELGSFVHEIEAILDQARSGDLEITSEITDILLDATDVIKDAKKSIVKGKPPEISKSLLKSVAKFQEQKEVNTVEVIDVHQRTFHLGSLERFNLMAHRHTGHSVYQLFLCFKPEFQHTFLVALLILKRISKIGNIFGTVPSIEEIENQNIEKQLKIMFSSQLDKKGLEKFIEDVLVKYYDVTEFEILKTF